MSARNVVLNHVASAWPVRNIVSMRLCPNASGPRAVAVDVADAVGLARGSAASEDLGDSNATIAIIDPRIADVRIRVGDALRGSLVPRRIACRDFANDCFIDIAEAFARQFLRFGAKLLVHRYANEERHAA